MASITTLAQLDSGSTSRTVINANFAALNAAIGTWTKETPSGSHDGSNLTYTLAHVPLASSLDLAVGGQIFTEGVDYSIGGLSGKTITLTTALPAGYTGQFKAKYIYSS